MPSTIIMPQLGETVAEGKILAWFKSAGDEIKRGDNLFEVETDKVTVEVQAIVAGRLSAIRVGSGMIAKVGEVVALVSDETMAKAAEPAEAPPAKLPQWRSPFEEVTTPSGRFGRAKGSLAIHLTPLARRLIAQHGLDLAALARDAGRRGAKTIDGAAARAAIAARPAVAATPDAGISQGPTQSGREDGIIALNTIRQRTAERLVESWRAIPHAFQAVDVDFTLVDRERARHKEAFGRTHGFSLTYLPFVARATCLAIAAFPKVNARFNGNALVLSRQIILGVAVDLDHNGLVVPVIRDAGDLTLVGLAKAIRRQIDKAKEGRLSPDDISGATYSISNNGSFGTSFTVPIINAPQVCILSIDSIRLKPAVVSTAEGDFVAPRMIGTLGQSFDHRAFDGAYAAAFLSRLKQIIEMRNWAEEFSLDL
jgi:pyruvate/2-oxoglutarate dehydrogenase complex dihydrolipoamide acyltransferase (E2) component